MQSIALTKMQHSIQLAIPLLYAMKYNINILKWNHFFYFILRQSPHVFKCENECKKNQDLPPLAAAGYFLQRAECMTVSLAFVTE
jgi:hypothetical protein